MPRYRIEYNILPTGIESIEADSPEQAEQYAREAWAEDADTIEVTVTEIAEDDGR